MGVVTLSDWFQNIMIGLAVIVIGVAILTEPIRILQAIFLVCLAWIIGYVVRKIFPELI